MSDQDKANSTAQRGDLPPSSQGDTRADALDVDDQDLLASAESTSDQTGPLQPSVDAPAKAGANAEDENFGIDLSEDELWDENADLEDIILFQEEHQRQHEKKSGSQAAPAPHGLDHDASPAPEQEAPAETSMEDPPDPTEDGPSLSSSSGQARTPGWLGWILSGISVAVFVGGLFFLWRMVAPYINAEKASSVPPTAVTAESPAAGVSAPQSQIPLTGENENSPLITIQMAPFLIPVTRGGEMVFLKLQVEIIVPDASTKKALQRKDAWVRDAIYGELKGIDVNEEAPGNFLLKYRRPIIERLNREFAPLRVEDVRLMGLLLS